MWDIAIVDECHYVKNPKAQRSEMVYAIQAKRRLFLTGTPICNRPKELFPIIHLLDPEHFKSFFGFAKRYCNAYYNGFGWDFSGASNLEELQDKLRKTVMVRRFKKDVLKELPAKRRQIIELPCNGFQPQIEKEQAAWQAHEELVAELRARVMLAQTSDDPEDYKKAVEALRDGARESFDRIAHLQHETALLKIPMVIEHLKDVMEQNGKVIVFAHHLDVINRLVSEFGDQAVCIQGCTPKEKRQEAVDRFQTDDNVRIFVGSIAAAGVGITLTASAHVVFAELDWVPGNLSQAEDRAHRIGQTDSVLIQHLVLEGSIDATMARTLVEKQEVIDRALDREYILDDLNGNLEAALALVEAEEERERRRQAAAKAMETQAAQLTPEQIATIHLALQILSGMCDGAFKKDEMGFNKIDARIGKELAFEPALRPKQAVLGMRIVRKYHRQLGHEMMTAIYGPDWDKKEKPAKGIDSVDLMEGRERPSMETCKT